jgi:hypothetical protein
MIASTSWDRKVSLIIPVFHVLDWLSMRCATSDNEGFDRTSEQIEW